MGMRNYCAVYYDEDTGKLNFRIQAEAEVGIKGTKGYLVQVPKLVFGLTGFKLHTVDHKKALLLCTAENSLPASSPLPEQQKQRRQWYNISCFLRPLFFWK